MRKVIRHTYVLLLTFSLSMIWADCYMADFPQNPTCISHHGTDKQNTIDDSRHEGHEENILITNCGIHSNKSNDNINVVPIVTINIFNNFISNIWQPPKIA